MDLLKQLKSSKLFKGTQLLKAYLNHPIRVTGLIAGTNVFIPVYDDYGFAYSMGSTKIYTNSFIIESVARCIERDY